MQVRSLELLDLDAAWKRLLFRARRFIDVPDRLPYEVIDRVSRGTPYLDEEIHLRPVLTVMATKSSGTLRPFVRLSPIDLLLYQALVDVLAPVIEARLQETATVFAYRLDQTGAENPFEGSPRWEDFMTSVRAELASERWTHAVTGDVASYFIYIDVEELERRLLGAGGALPVVSDLGVLLRAWQTLGVRGLPQGVPPSSPLGNFYLAPLDDLLSELGLVHRRYMDDFWFFTSSYEEARKHQDAVERFLYSDALGLGGEKTRIRRVETALRDTEPAHERIQRRREDLADDYLASIDGEYIDLDAVDIPEAEIDEAAAHAEFDELADELAEGRYPEDARSRVIEVLRELEKGRDAYAVSRVPMLLERMPYLTWDGVRYLSAMREGESAQSEAALLDLLRENRFHRDQEWLYIARAGLLIRATPSLELAERFGDLALNHPHALVRARALLAWGRLSDAADFAIADDFWRSAEPAWQGYVLVAIQQKQRDARDERYTRWSAEGRFLRTVTEAIQARPFQWKVV